MIYLAESRGRTNSCERNFSEKRLFYKIPAFLQFWRPDLARNFGLDDQAMPDFPTSSLINWPRPFTDNLL